MNNNSEKEKTISDNIRSILIYTITLAAALGFNDLIIEIFDSFKWSSRIFAKMMYFIIIFIIAIILSYYLNK